MPFTPFRTITLDMTYSAHLGAAGMERSLDWLCSRAETVVLQGWNVIVLSDREMGPDRIAIPSLLATSAIHHHLIRKGLRTSVGLVVETGEPHEVHQFAALAGYGAEAINPYLAFETIEANLGELDKPISKDEAFHRYVKAIGKGLMKVMSKMGISTYQSYCGAQIFDAVGLKSEFVAKWFTGTHTAVEGVGLDEIAGETAERHRLAFADVPVLQDALDVGGEYAFRMRGELHAWNPDTIADLQHAVRGNSQEKYRAFAKQLNDQSEKLMTIRGLFRLKDASEIGRTPIPIDEVEPAKEIVKRFATGAMSFGSISREAHTTLAIAMNRIGGKSNTGEGGEEPDRFKPLPNGDSQRSAIKQVASGRFGVTRVDPGHFEHDEATPTERRRSTRRNHIAGSRSNRSHFCGALFLSGGSQMSRQLDIAWLIGVVVASALTSAAQSQNLFEQLVMPGPVVKGHAKLEKDCGKCHEPFSRKSQTRRCLDCHKEIAVDRTTGRGLHGRRAGYRKAGMQPLSYRSQGTGCRYRPV